MTARRRAATVLGSVAVVLVAVAAGVGAYLSSAAHARHDPVQALQQLDLLYLDEPAPLADVLGLPVGTPSLLVVCDGCDPPPVTVPVVVSADPTVARAYVLARPDGTVGPGYAVIDADRRVRYRTYDPGVAAHAREIGILLDGLP